MPRFLPLLAFLVVLVPNALGQFRPADAPALTLLPPLGVVSLIGQGNRAAFDPNASADAAEMLRQALFRHDEKLHLQGQVVLKDSAAQRRAAIGTARLLRALQSQRKAAMAQPQPWLDSLLATRQQRYGLIGCVQGFTRTAANRRAMLARDLGLGLLSAGLLMGTGTGVLLADTPVAATRLSVCIYDAQTHRTVYYKTNFPAEKDPLAGFGEVIDRELTSLLAKDFNLTE